MVTLILIWIHHHRHRHHQSRCVPACVCQITEIATSFFLSCQMCVLYMRYKTLSIHLFEVRKRTGVKTYTAPAAAAVAARIHIRYVRLYVSNVLNCVWYIPDVHTLFIYICMVDCDCDCIGILFDLFDVRRYVRIRWALHKINVRHATHLTFINRIECVRERMNGVSAARTNLRTQAN